MDEHHLYFQGLITIFLKLIFIVRLHFKCKEHSGLYLYSYTAAVVN